MLVRRREASDSQGESNETPNGLNTGTNENNEGEPNIEHENSSIKSQHSGDGVVDINGSSGAGKGGKKPMGRFARLRVTNSTEWLETEQSNDF